jgi:hypothetical protein
MRDTPSIDTTYYKKMVVMHHLLKLLIPFDSLGVGKTAQLALKAKEVELVVHISDVLERTKL